MTERESTKQNILKSRARRLAERPAAATTTEIRESILIFKLGDERFAVRLGDVAGVVPFERVTPVPTAGPGVLGVMSIRGEVHAVYAFERVLELPRPGTPATDGFVIALRGVDRQVAARVDRVEGIDQIPAGAKGSGGRRFVTPVGSAPLILIEDLETVFHSLIRGEDQ